MHINDGNCQKCREILNMYPRFDVNLLSWFTIVQAKYPWFHCAEAGRGETDQEIDFHKGASKAHYGQSAHNYNAAIDTFCLINGKYSLDESYYAIIEPEIPEWIQWGFRWETFPEKPHFEIKGWKNLAATGQLGLVE